MRKRKLQKYVIPSLCGGLLSIIIICLGLLSKFLPENINYQYATDGIVEAVMPVIGEEKIIVKPVDDHINIVNKYYSKDADKNTQQESLIYYNDTYMPSTGISYSSDDQFNVYNVLDGTIKSIEKDELLGNVITIDHGDNILSIYYSVDNITFKTGDFISAGSIIANSSKNQIYGESYVLLFEVSVDGKLINPDYFFTMNLNN